jgi:hypothetical protein
MYRIAGLLTLLMLLTAIYSCREPAIKRPFDKQDWEYKDDMEYPYRNAMVDDLIEGKKLPRLSYTQMINLLGRPQGRGDDTSTVYYEVVVDYGNDIDPVYTKSLVITIANDSTVSKAAIKEWRNN